MTELQLLAQRLHEPWPAEAAAWQSTRAGLGCRNDSDHETHLERRFPHAYRPAVCHCTWCGGRISGWDAVMVARDLMDP